MTIFKSLPRDGKINFLIGIGMILIAGLAPVVTFLTARQVMTPWLLGAFALPIVLIGLICAALGFIGGMILRRSVSAEVATR